MSVCRGGEGRVWNVEKSNQLAQFSWQPSEYRLKNCRYGHLLVSVGRDGLKHGAHVRGQPFPRFWNCATKDSKKWPLYFNKSSKIPAMNFIK